MPGLAGKGKVREASIAAVVTRADGSVEDLGVIDFWHRNPLRRLRYRLMKMRGKVVKDP